MTEENQQPTNPSIVEVSWTDLEGIWKIRETLLISEEEFKEMTLQYEKAKTNLMARIIQAQNSLYRNAEALREQKEIPSEIVYELKLPDAAGEKGYFVRKEQ